MADKHVGDGESQFKVVSSAPDVCKVGTSFIPFDSFQTLDSQKQYVLSVKARGHFTLNVGSIIKGTQSNAGSGIISGTSLGNGDCQIITGSPSVRIEGQPAAQHGSLTLMNDMNTLGNLQTKVDPPTNPIESNRIPCNNPPKTSRNLELLQILKEQEQASFIGRIRMKKQEIGHKLAQARDDLDKTADDRIDNIRVDHINTNYPWFDDMYNNNMDDLTGITRAGLGVLKDSVIGVSYLIDYHPANLYADSLLNNSVNTIDFLTTLEQWNLGNNCFEGLTEDAQKKIDSLKNEIGKKWDKLSQKWDKGRSDKTEIVVRGAIEVATLFAAFLKTGKVAEVANTTSKISEGATVTQTAAKGAEASQLTKGNEVATAASEATKSADAGNLTKLDNGIKIEAKGKEAPKTASDKIDNTKTEGKSTSNSKDTDGNSAKNSTNQGDPVNVATGDFIQQWKVISLGGLLPLSLHRTYKSTSTIQGLFGRKWADEWSRTLKLDDNTIHFQDSDGAVFSFNISSDEIRSRNLHAPHYLLTGTRDGELVLFDSLQQQFLHFNHRNGSIRHLSAITDLNHNRIDFNYNDKHQLVNVKRNDGIQLILEYQQDRLHRIIDDANKREPCVFVSCEYDTNGFLTTCEAYQQNHLWHKYSSNGLMLAWGDTDSTSLTIEYDEKERVIATHSSSGYWNDQFVYDDIQRMTTYIDGEGNYYRYYYNDDNLVVRTIDPLWRETHTEWKCRQKISEINPLGERTEYGYHYDGQLAYCFLPDGRHFYYDYNENGQLISHTLPTGEKWQLDYDVRGNLTTVTTPQGLVQTYEYSQHGELLKSIAPNGAQWQYQYNATHQLIKSTNPYQQSTEYQFDELGRLQAYTDALKHTTQYRYDPNHAGVNGSVSNILLPDGVQQQIEYDSERRVVAVTDGEARTTRYRYGPFDLLTSMIRPDGTAIHFEYDALTRLKKVINALGETYTYERDAAGQIIRETDFAGRVLEYRYDRLGRRIATRYPDKHELRWRYAPSGVVIEQSEWLDDGLNHQCLSTTTYEYDTHLRLIKATNPDSVVEFEYDAHGQLTCERINGREVHHQWDEATQALTQTRFGERELHYAFGLLGELTQLQVNQHRPLEFSYNAVGQEYLRRSDVGFVNSSHYNAAGLLAHQRAGRGSDNFLWSLYDNPHQPPMCSDVHRDFHYNRAHNVVAIEDARWQRTQYHYNANDQITETQYSSERRSQYERFQYDANLNLTEHTTLPEDAHTAIIQLAQEQQAGRVIRRNFPKGHKNYFYDANGRLERKMVYRHGYRPQEWRYQWNTQNQLIRCFTPSGDVWRYTYDAFGRRLSKTKVVDILKINESPAFPLSKQRITAWHYLWSGDQMVEETPVYADGTIAYDAGIQWVYQPGAITPAARYQHGKLHYVVTDHQGTPREMFTENGVASWAGRLNTWGQLAFWESREGRAENDPNYIDCHFRFAGQFEDNETGLYYNRFRYYDKDSGQYISPDPIGLLGGFNPYGYVHNPTKFIDPFGLAGDCCDQLYIPHDANGKPIPLDKQRVNGQDIPLPDPMAEGRAHTVLGGKISSEDGLLYRQSATFPSSTWPTANGKPVPFSEVHWGDHGKPHHHPNPHQHQFIYENKFGWKRQEPTPYFPTKE